MSVSSTRFQNIVVIFLLICGISLLTCTKVQAANYYVDSASGNDSQAGTSESAPWKTLSKLHSMNFQPGDVISFKKGGTWDGPLVINDSGSSSDVSRKPITYTAYGSGALPVITGRGGTTHKRAIEVLASWIIISDLRIDDAAESGIEIFEGNKTTGVFYDNNLIQRMEFNNVGIGVTIKSNNNTVQDSTFDGFRMVRNTLTPTDDDYGALAVNLNGAAARTNMGRQSLSGNTILRNKVKNAKAQSNDYGFDGGFIEIFEDVDNTTVAYNWVEDSKGFIEIGGTQHSAKVENLKLHHNVSINNSLFSFVNTGTYGIGIANYQVLNNLIYEPTSTPKTAFWFDGSATIGPGEFVFKNNIVYNKATVSNKNSFTHENNIYYRLDRQANQSNTTPGDIGLTMTGSEKNVDAQFVDAATKNFTLKSSSPAKNAGQSVGIKLDFANASIPQGSASDIGPYEYREGQTTQCAEDINQDGKVDAADRTLLLAQFFKRSPSLTRSDINADGIVNIKDYFRLVVRFDKGCL